VIFRENMAEADRCSLCNEPAVIRGRERDQRLCGVHLVKDMENRVSENIAGQWMISSGDHIAVALSGGKDSTVLLLILQHLLPAWSNVRITAITIDEGIAGYREATIQAAMNLTAQLGVSHHIISFADLFGEDLDTLLKGREERACTICGVLRRKALAEGARRVGATKLATGHNRDDEAQSVLMNVFRNDLLRLVQDSSSGEPDCFIPRIKPLSAVTEKEVVTYLFVRDSYTELPECPYTTSALRSEIRTILSDLEYRHPGTRDALIRSQDILRKSVSPRSSGDLSTCRECGEICNGEICQACRILDSLRN
jgi:uncharacterized protein (TIGR00269 family)